MKFNFGFFSVEIYRNILLNQPETLELIESIYERNLPNIGDEMRGGYYAGKIDNQAIVISPKSIGETTCSWYDCFKFAKKTSGWSVPTLEELWLIKTNFLPEKTTFECFKYRNKEAFRTGWYWSEKEAGIDFSYEVSFDRSMSLKQTTRQKVDNTFVRLVKRIDIV